MDFDFAKGDDVEIRLDQNVLGGVTKAVCNTKSKFTDIGSFLSDVPVCREAENSYVIELFMDYSFDNPFDRTQKFNSLEFICGQQIEAYLDCTVESVSKTINAVGVVQSRVVIKAEERKVYDGQQI